MINENNYIINSKCICNKGLGWSKKIQIILEPCNHIFHNKCFSKQVTNSCPICGIMIEGINTKDGLINELTKKHKKKTYQKYVDMVSVSNFDDMGDEKRNLLNMIELICIIGKVPFASGFNDGHKVCVDLLSLLGTKLLVSGMENIPKKGGRIYIANHTSYLDMAILFYLFKSSFLASSVIKDTWIGNQLKKIVPLLIIERGKNINTVEKIKNHVQKYGSICLFPEGMITHPDTIIRFRTGAFNTGYPVCPVVIKYGKILYDTNITNFIKKLTTEPNIKINVYILPQVFPPFSDEKIEQVRNDMAKIGNMALSRVSNRDLKDKN